ncbi:hypothetical protein [Brucella intermedia]|uniref:hypothetical protein n=1 Tax=Brucella intermedia TaxID=94625 RepID=UPI00224A9CFC|nr:hypothetical protein [Brucella intermedia]
MSTHAEVQIAQITVKLEDGSYGVVVLGQDRLNMLMPMIEALSEGPVKILRVPGIQEVHVEEALK